MVIRQTPLAADNDGLRGSRRLFVEDIENHDRVSRDVVHNPPVQLRVDDAQFVATRADARHRPRVREAERFTALESAQQETGFDPGVGAEGRRFDFSAAARPAACRAGSSTNSLCQIGHTCKRSLTATGADGDDTDRALVTLVRRLGR